MQRPAKVPRESGRCDARPPLLVAAFQSDARANGGLSSLSALLERLETFAPVVLTDRESEFTRRWRLLGCEVHVWPDMALGGERSATLRRVRRAGQLVAVNQRVRGLLMRLGCRLVHVNDIQALMHVAPAARLLGCKVLFSIRSTQGVRGLRWRLARALSHRLVALSGEMREHLERELSPLSSRWPAASIEAVYSVVDLERMRPPSVRERAAARAARGIGEREFALGFVGVFDRRKQQLELLRALAERPGALPDGARLYCVGDFEPERDDYSRRCQALIDSPALCQRVVTVGYTDDVIGWYHALDALILPSRHEGLARAMIEGLACGLPVVSFAVCSAREILVQHDSGLVVEQGDFEGLFAACHALHQNEVLARRLSKNAAATARQLFEPRAVVSAFERQYADLLGSGA
jgi:glycosyltransferase involved in cell wall biosynthesis